MTAMTFIILRTHKLCGADHTFFSQGKILRYLWLAIFAANVFLIFQQKGDSWSGWTGPAWIHQAVKADRGCGSTQMAPIAFIQNTVCVQVSFDDGK